MKQQLKYLRAVYVTMGLYFLYKNLLMRSLIFSEMNKFGLPKLSKISLAFNFVPIREQEIFHLRLSKKITQVDICVPGTIDQKRI